MFDSRCDILTICSYVSRRRIAKRLQLAPRRAADAEYEHAYSAYSLRPNTRTRDKRAAVVH